MMEQDLRSLLKADASIAALANEVDWDEIKQGTLPPFIVLEMAFDPRDKRMDGAQATRITKVRVKCVHTTPADGHNLKEYVISACEAATGTNQGDTRFLGIFPNVLGSSPVDTPDGIRNGQIIDLDICHTPIP